MENNNQQVSITVLIAGRPYPLKIQSNDEPTIRKIVKDINDHVTNFQLKYTTKDKQDCLSMAALTYAVDAAKAKSKKTEITNNTSSSSAEQSALFAQLSDLESLLDSALRNSK